MRCAGEIFLRIIPYLAAAAIVVSTACGETKLPDVKSPKIYESAVVPLNIQMPEPPKPFKYYTNMTAEVIRLADGFGNESFVTKELGTLSRENPPKGYKSLVRLFKKAGPDVVYESANRDIALDLAVDSRGQLVIWKKRFYNEGEAQGKWSKGRYDTLADDRGDVVCFYNRDMWRQTLPGGIDGGRTAMDKSPDCNRHLERNVRTLINALKEYERSKRNQK